MKRQFVQGNAPCSHQFSCRCDQQIAQEDKGMLPGKISLNKAGLRSRPLFLSAHYAKNCTRFVGSLPAERLRQDHACHLSERPLQRCRPADRPARHCQLYGTGPISEYPVQNGRLKNMRARLRVPPSAPLPAQALWFNRSYYQLHVSKPEKQPCL